MSIHEPGNLRNYKLTNLKILQCKIDMWLTNLLDDDIGLTLAKVQLQPC